jgi:SAM-dependent methyltransferase
MSKLGRTPRPQSGIAWQALSYLKRGLGSYWRDRDAFEKWQKRNPSKSFKDFYAETVEAKLQNGEVHQNLGPKIPGGFGETGSGFFERLVRFGLKPEDSLVDYGCGTLRMGVHAIKYLEPGKYWGLDISEFLLEQGRELIGEELYRQKQPHLHVISAESVRAAAAAKPAMLISLRVCIHVHPDDLTEYVHNLVTIIGDSGEAIVTGKWSCEGTVQYSNRSWAHGLSTLEDIVKAEGGGMQRVKLEDSELDGLDTKAVSGMIRIVRGQVAPRTPR